MNPLTLDELKQVEALNHRVHKRLEYVNDKLGFSVNEYDVKDIDVLLLAGQNQVEFVLEYVRSGDRDWFKLPIECLTLDDYSLDQWIANYAAGEKLKREEKVRLEQEALNQRNEKLEQEHLLALVKKYPKDSAIILSRIDETSKPSPLFSD